MTGFIPSSVQSVIGLRHDRYGGEMYAAGIIGGVVVLILASLLKRMLELRATPLILWPVLLVAGVAPAWVTYDVLHPRAVTDSDGNPIVAQVTPTHFDYEKYGKDIRNMTTPNPLFLPAVTEFLSLIHI